MCASLGHMLSRVPMLFCNILCSLDTGAIACPWPKHFKQIHALYRTAGMILLNRKRRRGLDLHQPLVRNKDCQSVRMLLG